MKPSEALKIARDTLPSTGRWPFIGDALFELNNPGASKARAYILHLLSPYQTYGTWLEHYHPEWYEKYASNLGAYLEARLCWIDDMIKYWEAKGE